MPQPKRLWDKGLPVHERIHRFTVGDDPVLDRELLPWDCVGSAAHARMLRRIGILSEKELQLLLAALVDVHTRAERRTVEIPPELEDCHSTLEHLLVQSCGEAGKKIHTGRSRNDQVVLTLRLFLRDALAHLLLQTTDIVQSLLDKAQKDGNLPMPGYTHMQPAMPSSVGLWIHAWVEALLESLNDGRHLFNVMNQNPLGAGAGFGVPLALDRCYVAQLLAFERTQESVIDVQNSRGRYERKLLFWITEVGATIEKLASDLMLFTTKEFGFVKLPDAYTTGSSLMPQKRNPDVLELVRGSVSSLRGALGELTAVTTKLPSSYHRDFQLSKGPLLRGVSLTRELLAILPTLMNGLRFDAARLQQAMYPELYVTYAAIAQASGGTPFRDAYQTTAGGDYDAMKREHVSKFDAIAEASRRALDHAAQALAHEKAWTSTKQQALTQAYTATLTAPVTDP